MPGVLNASRKHEINPVHTATSPCGMAIGDIHVVLKLKNDKIVSSSITMPMPKDGGGLSLPAELFSKSWCQVLMAGMRRASLPSGKGTIMENAAFRPDTINAVSYGADSALAMPVGMWLEVFTPLEHDPMPAVRQADRQGY